MTGARARYLAEIGIPVWRLRTPAPMPEASTDGIVAGSCGGTDGSTDSDMEETEELIIANYCRSNVARRGERKPAANACAEL